MYKVYWAPSALDDLAGLWIDADPDSRNSITAAAAQIDALLLKSPNDIGESRPNNRRIEFVSPLGFTFEVRPAHRRVVVIHV
jgi:hypothetical protein